MKSELDSQAQSIRTLIKRTKAACEDDIELMAHWARYLCIVCAGFLERALVDIYSDFCRKAASEHVANFATRALRQTSNPKTSRFLELAGQFRADWRSDLEAFVNADGRREAIDSIMANRNLIAHGQTCDITVARISDYFSKAVRVLDFVTEQCGRRK